MASASAIDGPTQRKMSGQGVVRARRGNSLVMPNEAMDIIRIVKSLANSGLLIDGVNETVKQEIKKQEGGVFGMLLETLGASMLGNMLTGKGVLRPGRTYDNMDHTDKKF